MKKFTFNKTEKSEEFFCIRCQRKKKSKNTASNEQGEKLCNGCYGLLLSKDEIAKG